MHVYVADCPDYDANVSGNAPTHWLVLRRAIVQEPGKERETDEGDEALDKEECNEKKKKTGRHAPSSPPFLRRHPVRPGRAGPFMIGRYPAWPPAQRAVPSDNEQRKVA
jgi:hypothetical protein